MPCSTEADIYSVFRWKVVWHGANRLFFFFGGGGGGGGVWRGAGEDRGGYKEGLFFIFLFFLI